MKELFKNFKIYTIFVGLFVFTLLNPAFVLAWPWNSEPETTSSKLNNERSEFKDLIDSFNKSSEKLNTELKDGKDKISTFKEAVKIATDRNVEFKKIYGKWNSIQSQVEKTTESLKQLTSGADEFYKATETHIKTITDVAKREDALKKMQASKENYIQRLKSTKSKIEKVTELKIKVDDTMKYLEAVMAIEVFDEQIKLVFDQIDKLIPDLAEDIKQLNIDSQNFLNSKLADSTQGR